MLLLLPAALAQAPPIVNGTPTTDHPSVGALMVCQKACAVLCTATLITEQHILTAAHCAEDAMAASGAVRFVVGPESSAPQHTADIAQWTIHPEHDTRSSGDAQVLVYDIAVATLAAPVDGAEVLSLSAEVVNSTWIGAEITYVGYGITGDGLGDAGTARQASVPIVDFDNYNLYALDTDKEQNTCSGDSGGPAIRTLDGLGEAVVGVSSFVYPSAYDTPCAGGGSGAARVDVAADFITAAAPGARFVGGSVPGDTGGDTDSDTGGDTGGGGAADGCGRGCAAPLSAGWLGWLGGLWGLLRRAGRGSGPPGPLSRPGHLPG